MEDSTQAIQEMLDRGGNVKVPAGDYWIDAIKSLTVPGGTNVDLSGVTLRAIPNDKDRYSILTIKAENVTVRFGTLIGDRDAHGAETGEWGHCLSILGGVNVSVTGTLFTNAWGDGIYIGGPSENVVLDSVDTSRCRRQGLSITSARDVRVIDSSFEATGGTRPGDGIDIEPNPGNVIESVSILRCRLAYNENVGIEVAGKRGTVRDVTIANCSYVWQQPLKIDGVPEAGKYKPSFWAKLLGFFRIWTLHPTSARIA